MARVVSPAATSLLAGLVDYAGLFPPAGLGMEAAAAEYARQRRSSEGWMLGRFVLPAARLGEFETAAAPHLSRSTGPWHLSALIGADVNGDVAMVRTFNERLDGRALVDALELKGSTVADIDRVLTPPPSSLTAYVELPATDDLTLLLRALKERGARAKVRTGGVTPESIPSTAGIARFLVACAETGVPFKATAGLHHPIRSLRPLTYAADSHRAVMHGFLNLFAAAALAQSGAAFADVEAVLREERPAAFALGDDGLSVGQHRISPAALSASRTTFALSFGSCSFAEPVADLEALGIL